ncbi:hypothetical protein GUJ93_ZPchr0010g9794 [Zizania palustris]|uniref:Uncharacterized protein n=1 Tax=Zizania palustris TaxID=103762 RepID=A0A8J5WFD9_ZIZPA|nr:hypothetical protein GUJ93_ZPchr0010g9794 [Zizania palustris]
MGGARDLNIGLGTCCGGYQVWCSAASLGLAIGRTPCVRPNLAVGFCGIDDERVLFNSHEVACMRFAIHRLVVIIDSSCSRSANIGHRSHTPAKQQNWRKLR